MARRLLLLLSALSLFGLIWGAKLALIERYGVDIPRVDQYDAEGLMTFLPYLQNRLTWEQIYQAHNEHRVVWTKLLALAELIANGQWDARLQCVVNAALHGAIAVFLFLYGCRSLGGRLAGFLFLLVAALFAAPTAWENTISGFHSQQYFLLGFSLVGLALLPFSQPWTRHWWLGAAAIFAALVTMGSGLFAAGLVPALVVLQGWRERRLAAHLSQHVPTLVVAAIAFALGLWGFVHVPGMDHLRAQSLTDFLRFSLHSLQWPSSDWGVLALVFWLPTALLLARVLRPSPAPAGGTLALVLAGWALWTLLQIAASAFARGVDGGMPSSRYLDTLAFGLIVNGFILAWLWRTGAARWLRLGLSCAWSVAAMTCLGLRTRETIRETLPAVHGSYETYVESLRAYVATGDRSHLDPNALPYPGVQAMRDRIDPAPLRRILPVSIHAPLALEPSSENPAGFVQRDTVRLPGKYYPPAPPEDTPPPALASRRVWTSAKAVAAGRWTSRPLMFEQDVVLRFLVAGVAGHPATTLTLRNSRDGTVVASADLRHLEPQAWQAVHVPVPAGTVTVVAETGDAAHWLAFSEPSEMKPLSYWSWRVTRRGNQLAGFALAAAVVIGLASLPLQRPEKNAVHPSPALS